MQHSICPEQLVGPCFYDTPRPNLGGGLEKGAISRSVAGEIPTAGIISGNTILRANTTTAQGV